MCQFLETIKYEDGKFFFLNYHQERVNRTFANFYIEKKPFDLEEALENEDKPKQGLYRCRVIYNSTIQKIEFIEQKPRDINTLKVVHCESIDYSYKYLNRDLINELLKQKENCDDIIIIKNGFVTDTSIGNILFFDGKQWFTPDSPLLPGTTRARLVNEGIVQERKIQLSDISEFLGFQVVNALIQFSNENQNPVENIHL